VSGTTIQRSVVVESKPRAITLFCRWVLSRLKANDFSQDDIFAVHLALEEAFLNAVRHGNSGDPDKEVQIDCSLGGDRVEISMTDAGDGFNPKSVPDPRYGDNLYRIEGRGLFLIRSYMHKVDFNERGNRISMIRYKGRPSPAEVDVRQID